MIHDLFFIFIGFILGISVLSLIFAFIESPNKNELYHP